MHAKIKCFTVYSLCLPVSAAGMPANNVAIMPGLLTSVGASTGNLPVADSTSQVGMMSSMVPMPSTIAHLPPTCDMSSIAPHLPVISNVPLSFTSLNVTDTSSAITEPTTAWQAPQPSVVAGVDLSQLPPLQRELFLRIHQQQKGTTIDSASSIVSHNPAPPQTATAVITPHGMTHICSRDFLHLVLAMVWRGSVMVRASDLQPRAPRSIPSRGASRSTLGKLFTHCLCSPSSKLVPVQTGN